MTYVHEIEGEAACNRSKFPALKSLQLVDVERATDEQKQQIPRSHASNEDVARCVELLRATYHSQNKSVAWKYTTILKEEQAGNGITKAQ